jgi:transposase
MPGKRKETMDVREIIRHLREGRSDRAIALATGVDRKTVARYRVWAVEHELLSRPLPPLGELHRMLDEMSQGAAPPQNVSSVEPYRELVRKLREAGVEMTAIWQRLQERGYTGTYWSVRRFVRRMEPSTPEVTVRVETRPGEEAQVDFGYAGQMVDPETGEIRRAWLFVMLLSWSRHMYVEFVFDQKVETWLRLHCNALAYFGGVPERVVIDNLKAGIPRICFDEPQAQHAYRECAEHYGFLISPCRPRTPQHKGKVEQGGVHYVKRNFLAGRERMTLTQANQEVLRWVETTAGRRIHGTTRERPLARFEAEREVLRPLPPAPYELAVWKKVKLHRDCYLHFESAYYSAPFRFVGLHLWVRGGTRRVQVYTSDYQLVASHPCAQRPGQRVTHLNHLPPAKLPGLILSRDGCRQRASQIGQATCQVVDRFLDHRPEDRLRMAGRLLRLAERFGDDRLEAACARAIGFDDPAYLTVKRILEEGLDVEQTPPAPPAVPARTFVRSPDELVQHLQGGVSWN